MDKQHLRNSLSDIEDEARAIRNTKRTHSSENQILTLIAKLAQLVREDLM